MNKHILRLPAMLLALVATAGAAQDVSRHEGTLNASSQRNARGQPFSDWDVWLNAGERVRVTVEARDAGIDPIIEIHPRSNRAGSPLARDDDSGGYPDARLDFAAPRADVYTFRVLSYTARGGDYEMTVEKLGTAAAATALPVLRAVNEGHFSNRSPRDARGAHYSDFAVDLRAGQQVLLRLDAAGFDPVLRIYASGGESGDPLATDDDSGEGLNALLLFTAPHSGRFTVRAAQFSHRDGPWTLRFNRLN